MIKGIRWTSVKGNLCAFALLIAMVVLFAKHWWPDSSNAGAALGPLARYAVPAGERLRFEGRVIDRLPASSYTYLLVERAGGAQSWVVTLASSSGAQSEVKRVHVLAMGYAAHFSSKRLARTFDSLYFAVVRPA